MPIDLQDDCTPEPATAAAFASQSNLTHRQLMDWVEVGKAITAELDPGKLLPTIMEKVSKLLPGEIWSLLLFDEKNQELRFGINIDLDPRVARDIRLPLGKGVAGHSALTQKPMIVMDVSRCPHFDPEVDRRTGHQTRSLICIPLIFGGRTLGVLEVVNPKNSDATAISLLHLIADYLAIAIENTRRYKKMQEMAVRDNLTGLYNQRYLYQNLARLIADYGAKDRPLSLIFMDMDDFKTVVDRLGHLNGSRALQEVAQRIRKAIASPGFAVAYGGDEFVIVLPEADHYKALAMADQIRQTLRSEPYLLQWGHEVSMTASFGVATYPDDAQDGTELLAFADQAMFSAKKTGKDQVRVCTGA
jgi:diguanylate cyclase (GGDEF)-like protein